MQQTDVQLPAGRSLMPTTDAFALKRSFNLRRRFRPDEVLIQAFLFFCGVLSIATTLGIVYVLVRESLLFFGSDQVRLLDFFNTTTWQPKILKFGIWPLLSATLMTSAIALLVAMPLGLSAAIYLSEYATPRARGTLKPILEVLAGVPTVVYGYFALTFMTPLLRALFGADTVNVYNTASAGLVMGIMILPLISSMSEDALSAVPRSLREASYGLGATKLQTAFKVMVPAASSGILVSVILAVSRALGETMIVAIAAGQEPKLTFNPKESVETITTYIVQVSMGDVPQDSLEYRTIYAAGLTLFLFTFLLNNISYWIRRKFQNKYE